MYNSSRIILIYEIDFHYLNGGGFFSKELIVKNWRRSEVAITRRTRNAFVGLFRREGSNPSVSALKSSNIRGFFVLEKGQLESKKIWR